MRRPDSPARLHWRWRPLARDRARARSRRAESHRDENVKCRPELPARLADRNQSQNRITHLSIIERRWQTILDGHIIYRSRGRIMNFDSIGDRVANFCPRTIG